MKALTEEVIALRNEVRQLKSMPSLDSQLSLLPSLPFFSLPSFKEFDGKLLLEDDIRSQLVGSKDIVICLNNYINLLYCRNNSYNDLEEKI